MYLDAYDFVMKILHCKLVESTPSVNIANGEVRRFVCPALHEDHKVLTQ